MKRWLRRDEWMELSYCGDSPVHTVDNPTPEQTAAAQSICGPCVVRPECIEWAIREQVSAVFVAGVYLPDPQYKKDLRVMYRRLEESLPQERQVRGDDI